MIPVANMVCGPSRSPSRPDGITRTASTSAKPLSTHSTESRDDAGPAGRAPCEREPLRYPIPSGDFESGQFDHRSRS